MVKYVYVRNSARHAWHITDLDIHGEAATPAVCGKSQGYRAYWEYERQYLYPNMTVCQKCVDKLAPTTKDSSVTDTPPHRAYGEREAPF